MLLRLRYTVFQLCFVVCKYFICLIFIIFLGDVDQHVYRFYVQAMECSFDSYRVPWCFETGDTVMAAHLEEWENSPYDGRFTQYKCFHCNQLITFDELVAHYS